MSEQNRASSSNSNILGHNDLGIEKFRVMEIYNRALKIEKEGKKVYHLELGQPGDGPTDYVRNKVIAFLQTDKIAYTQPCGTVPLKSAISKYYKEKYQIDISKDRIIITLGSSSAFIISYLSFLKKGAKIASAIPGYPCYRSVPKALGFEPYTFHLGAKDNFRLNRSILERELYKQDIGGLVIGNPANPTGTCIRNEDIQGIIDYCDEEKIQIFCDEVYHGLTYSSDSAYTTSAYSTSSFLEKSDGVVVINSFSKYFTLPGWRVGFCVLPEEKIAQTVTLASHLFVSPSAIAQKAALLALDSKSLAELELRKTSYDKKRKILFQALNDCGFSEIAPSDGAFYLYAKIPEKYNSSEELATELLLKTNIAITPGRDFDPVFGDKWLRLSYCSSINDILEASVILRQFFNQSSCDISK